MSNIEKIIGLITLGGGVIFFLVHLVVWASKGFKIFGV